MMDTVKEYRDRLKVLRGEKKALVVDIRIRRAAKQKIDAEMAELRFKIRAIKAGV